MVRLLLFVLLTAGALVAQGTGQKPAEPPKPAPSPAPKPPAGLAAVKKVYLLPMHNGLDQHLASELTRQKVAEVVVDPKKAEAVFTDRLGETFEAKISELFGAKKEDAKPGETIRGPGIGGKRNAGTVFLVDPASMTVLWSAYQPPKDSSRDSMLLCARKIVQQLAETRQPKKKKILGVF
jgi:hypothetical protein